MEKIKECPCKSGKKYQMCCQPLHEGMVAPNAFALMRSRYSAYALGIIDYVIKTCHPVNFEMRQKIEQFCRETEFKGLEILEVNEGDKTSTVTFKAILFKDGKECSFTEKSLFEKMDGKWFYVKAIELSSTA